jgi:hypothetical protein
MIKYHSSNKFKVAIKLIEGLFKSAMANGNELLGLDKTEDALKHFQAARWLSNNLIEQREATRAIAVTRKIIAISQSSN